MALREERERRRVAMLNHIQAAAQATRFSDEPIKVIRAVINSSRTKTYAQQCPYYGSQLRRSLLRFPRKTPEGFLSTVRLAVEEHARDIPIAEMAGLLATQAAAMRKKQAG